MKLAEGMYANRELLLGDHFQEGCRWTGSPASLP
jgi:hypothetical protein